MAYEEKFICTECKTKFVGTKLEHGSKCSVCKIGILIGYSDFQFPKMDEPVPEHNLSDADLFAIDEIEAEMESCTGCEFINECDGHCDSVLLGTDGVRLEEEFGLPKQISELSFNDMDINEKLLFDLSLEEETYVPITYIAEMNYRFLHTFVDGSFIPA